MAHPLVNEFTRYHLNQQEFHEGSKLSILQKQVIQNQVAQLSSELISLQPDPLNLTQHIQQQAHSLGGLHALMHLLECSSAAEQASASSADLRPEVIESKLNTNPFKTNQE